MIPIYHKSSYAWSLGDYKKSFSVLDDYLRADLGEEVFSRSSDFLDKADSSYWQFLHGLISNSNRINTFCSTFSSLWRDFPSYSVLRLLMVKDFSEPSMVKAFDMEDFGFEDPEEDFEKILLEFRKSANQGFLTSLPELGAFDGRVHLDFEHLDEFLDASSWLHYKSLLLDFERELNEIGPISWDKMLDSNHSLILSTFLHQAFGEFERNPTDNLVMITGSLELNPKWKDAISKSVEMILQELSEEELDELVNSICQIQSNELSGRTWLQKYLDYATDFSPETFLKLY